MLSYSTCIHIKTGIPYIILGVAIYTIDSEFDEKMIIYKNSEHKMFVREINEFFKEFEVDEEAKRRLKKVYNNE